MKKLAIIGGLGVLGSNLIKRLDNYEIACLDRAKLSSDSPIKKKIKLFTQGDASNNDDLRSVCDNADIVFFRAGILGGQISNKITSAETYLRSNTEGLIKLLDIAKECNVKSLIFDSSEQAYGLMSGATGNDTATEPYPFNYYGLSKVVAEKSLYQWYTENENVSVQLFRYSRILDRTGPGSILNMVTSALKSKQIKITGNRNHAISFVHMEDAMQANIKSLEIRNAFKIYNITSGAPISIYNLAQKIQTLLNIDIKFVFEDEAKETRFEPSIAGMNRSTTSADLDWEPKYTIDYIINEIIDFVKNESI